MKIIKSARCIRMKHILIIDDDVHIGDMLTEVLTLEGYAVLRACIPGYS